MISLRAGTVARLSAFVANQLNAMIPNDSLQEDVTRLGALMPAAIERITPMLNAVVNFRPGHFDHLHSLQYCAFLYILGNEASRDRDGLSLAERLFGLNRALNSIDLFYAITLPKVFFISHGLGSVLGEAHYGERLVVFQNVTVGRVGAQRPSIGNDVVLFPGSSVTGYSMIGDGSVVAAGTRVHNQTVPSGTLVSGDGPKLLMSPLRRDYTSLYFRESSNSKEGGLTS